MLLIVCLKTSDDNNIKVSVNKHKCYLKLLSDAATSILHTGDSEDRDMKDSLFEVI